MGREGRWRNRGDRDGIPYISWEVNHIMGTYISGHEMKWTGISSNVVLGYYKHLCHERRNSLVFLFCTRKMQDMGRKRPYKEFFFVNCLKLVIGRSRRNNKSSIKSSRYT